MFCAIVSSCKERTISKAEKKSIRSVIGKIQESIVTEWSSEHSYIVQKNVRSLNDYGGIWTSGPNEASVLAGEPLIEETPEPENEHRLLSNDLRDGDVKALKQACGVFCGVYVRDTAEGIRIVGVTDKFGIRTLYYTVAGDLIILASALRLVEGLSFVSRGRDLLGICEIVGFGYGLADRTHLSDVKLLPPATTVEFTVAGVRTRRYWNWGRIAQTLVDPVAQAGEAHRLLLRAVRRRVRNDKCVLATLSGGLDSRIVVATLREDGRDVVALNRTDSGMKDTVYSERIAKALGCHFVRMQVHSYLRTRAFSYGVRFVTDPSLRDRYGLERPQSVWSGDGGSVGVGCVYLNEAMVRLAREGQEREAVGQLMRHNLPLRLLKRETSSELEAALKDSAIRELASIDCEDRGQALVLFLMFNDQHRHMQWVYENEDELNQEYQMPLFDSDFVEHLFRIPLEQRLLHRFYNRFLRTFSTPVYETPWQVYPGHESGEFEEDADLEDQWNMTASLPVKPVDYPRLAEVFSIVAKTTPPIPVSKIRLLAASLLHTFGYKQCEYLLRGAGRFHELYEC